MNWKDHPLAIAAVAIAATSVFFFTVIIPIWVKTKENEIDALQKTIVGHRDEIRALRDEPERLKGNIKQLTARLQSIEEANVRLRRNFDTASAEKLFSPDEVYPRGFQAVRIGNKLELVAMVYGDVANIVDRKDWLEVKLKKPRVFHDITYYYDANASAKVVTHILFMFSGGKEWFQYFKGQLIDAYGESRMQEVTDRFDEKLLLWRLDSHSIELGNGTLVLRKNG